MTGNDVLVPQLLVTETVKVPLLLTVMDLVIAPLLQRLPVNALEVNMIELGAQIVVVPVEDEMVGIANGDTTIT